MHRERHPVRGGCEGRLGVAVVFIANEQRDRCAGGLSFEYTGENFDGIRLLPLGHMARGTGLATIQILLNIFC